MKKNETMTKSLNTAWRVAAACLSQMKMFHELKAKLFQKNIIQKSTWMVGWCVLIGIKVAKNVQINKHGANVIIRN
jgi:hypothetical protein